jgi:hypothetical protein
LLKLIKERILGGSEMLLGPGQVPLIYINIGYGLSVWLVM